jgi:hypothetical protein
MNNQENQIVPDKTPFLSGNGRSYHRSRNLSKKAATAAGHNFEVYKEILVFTKQRHENAHRDLHAYFWEKLL